MNRVPAKKYLGQNFLVDPRAVLRIITALEIHPDDGVLEIGPGQGALTLFLAQKAKNVFAVEKDPRMVALLREKCGAFKNLHVFQEDFLNFNLAQLPSGTKAIGNLPYNISTPIIEKFMSEPHTCRELFFTVQLEFGQRLAAEPGTKDYGSLSCFAQFFCDIDMLFKIPAACFRPIPKVTSCFIKMNFHGPRDPAVDRERLFTIIRTAFQQRRKTVRNALAPVLGGRLNEILEKTAINGNLRPENLALDDYIKITHTLDLLENES